MTPTNEQANLQRTLQLLNDKLNEAQARLRKQSRAIRTKEAFLAQSRRALRYEFKDAFSVDPPLGMKRHTLPPPPGLVPLLEEEVTVVTTLSSAPNDASVTDCVGCSIGQDDDRIWIRAVVSSRIPLEQAHLLLSADSHIWLPTEIACTTVYGLTEPTTLYTAFTYPPDVPFDQLKKKLRVACQYTCDGDWETTSAISIQWVQDWREFLPPPSSDALDILFPCRVVVQSPPENDRQTIPNVTTESAWPDYLFPQQQGMVIRWVAGEDNNAYMKALLVGLQDDMAYSEDASEERNLIAVRENTATLFSHILQPLFKHHTTHPS